jgi:hypothetical protein
MPIGCLTLLLTRVSLPERVSNIEMLFWQTVKSKIFSEIEETREFRWLHGTRLLSIYKAVLVRSSIRVCSLAFVNRSIDLWSRSLRSRFLLSALQVAAQPISIGFPSGSLCIRGAVF